MSDEISELERLISQSITSPSSSYAATPLHGFVSRDASLRQLRASQTSRDKDIQARDNLVQTLKGRIEVLERECDLSRLTARRCEESCQHLVDAQRRLNDDNEILAKKLATVRRQAEERESELERERIRFAS